MISEYILELQKTLNLLNEPEINLVINTLYKAWQQRKWIYVVGNGGSAATASHFVNDLVKLASIKGMPSIMATSLIDNVPLITAYANDESFESIFSEQLNWILGEGCIIVGISTSGNSLNILNCIKRAHELGATTIALTGKTGGLLSKMVDYDIRVSSENTPLIEDVHLAICHMIALSLKDMIERTDLL